jgi:outer membrane biosynthesis protein TonB
MLDPFRPGLSGGWKVPTKWLVECILVSESVPGLVLLGTSPAAQDAMRENPGSFYADGVASVNLRFDDVRDAHKYVVGGLYEVVEHRAYQPAPPTDQGSDQSGDQSGDQKPAAAAPPAAEPAPKPPEPAPKPPEPAPAPKPPEPAPKAGPPRPAAPKGLGRRG